MSKTKQNYAIGYGKPPVGRPFQKGQSGNPRGPRGRPGKNNLSALLLAALDEPVYVTIDGHRRKITKREAIVTQMVDKSASADLRATKMLIEMMKDVEQRTAEPGGSDEAAAARPLPIEEPPFAIGGAGDTLADVVKGYGKFGAAWGAWRRRGRSA